MIHSYIATFFIRVPKPLIFCPRAPYQIIVGHVVRYGKNLFLSVPWVCKRYALPLEQSSIGPEGDRRILMMLFYVI